MSQSFLVVRPDNIGDLVLTTPLIAALRLKFPDAWIGALVNTYNVPVLAGNPHLNDVFAYQKLKHAQGANKFGALFGQLGLIARLRAQHIDIALLASRGSQARSSRLAKLAGARRLVGYADADALPVNARPTEHEAQDVFRLARVFDIRSEPGPCEVFPQSHAVAAAQRVVNVPHHPLVAVHISARKPSQRWPIERFASLMQRIHEKYGAAFLLFWAPGAADDKLHPGDDALANDLLQRVKALPVTPFPTESLDALIAGLSLCDTMICSDGGAMHIAAALGKSILCFFGQSDANRWRPWGVPYELLQPPTKNVVDVSVDEASNSFTTLRSHPGKNG